MKSNKFTFALFFLGLSCFSCNEIIVPNISDKEVPLIAPPDGHIASAQTFTFWWEIIEDADTYLLQIVEPSFANPVTLVLDSLISGNRFDFTLFEGQYEWTVVGINSEYTSQGETRKLFVNNDSTDNLVNITMNLQLPLEEDCLVEDIVEFNWDQVLNADYYHFQVGDQDFNNLQINEEITSNTFNYNFVSEGSYYWRVRGVNESSLTFTPWAQSHFFIDRTQPDAAELTFPGEGDTIVIANQIEDLQWNYASDAVEDRLFLYADSNKDTLILEVALTDNHFNLDDSGIDFSDPDVEDYFWLVISRDNCFNFSNATPLRSFYIKE